MGIYHGRGIWVFEELNIYMNDCTQHCACLFLRLLFQGNTFKYEQTNHCENDYILYYHSNFLVAGFFDIFGTCLKAASRSMIIIMEPSKYFADIGWTGLKNGLKFE